MLPSLRNCCTSSKNPAAIMLCTRCSTRATNISRGHNKPICTTPLSGYAPVPGPVALNGLPLPMHTSSARSMRRRLLRSILLAASGSSSFSCRYKRDTSGSCCNSRRISGHSPGKLSSSMSDVRYKPVPATTSAFLPRPVMSATAARAFTW